MSGRASLIDLELLAPAGGGSARRLEPVRVGVPLARGACTDVSTLCLFDADGQPHALQARPLDRWTDGSIRWVLLDFRANHDGTDAPARYDIRAVEAAVGGGATLEVAEEADRFVVSTGAASFGFARRDIAFPTVSVGGIGVLDDVRSGVHLDVADPSGSRVRFDRAEIEDRGPVAVVVRLEGSRSRHHGSVAVTARLTLHAGSAAMRCSVTADNPRRATHPGGYWELGDPGSAIIRDLSVVLALPHGDGPLRVRWSPERSAPLRECAGSFSLVQASSGGERWQHPTHVDRSGAVALAFRGYVAQAGAARFDGLRAQPIVGVDRNGARVAVAMEHFWQNCPKAIEADGGVLTLRLFPEGNNPHELQGGERKTHAFAVAFGADDVTAVPLDWVRAPLVARATPAHYASTGAVAYLMPTGERDDPEYDALIGAAIRGPDAFAAKREAIDEYGWRNFGDLYADHESAFFRGAGAPVSHYNNQYDAIAGFARQFMASGDPRWWSLMRELAAHVADIDIYHTTEDKAAYNGGLFWHTSHYADAGRATHRAYPRAPGVWGGGPSNEHNYVAGLMLHYFMTGETLSRDSAIGLARWVIAMDDGDRTVFRWLARGATGLASSTGSTDYHGPGRGAGNSIVALLVGHQLTGSPEFLAKAESLIQRTIHPADDPGSFDLLNREARWSYTVFLCALGRYLDYKSELGAFDTMFAYARASLVNVAQWMAVHEYPYLERPEQLEYPTETWAAQEVWKSEAFAYGALHAVGEAWRARLLERSEFFFRYATTTLSGMPTRNFTRPVVLLLSRGHMHRQIRARPELPAPPAALPSSFAPRERFEPQKARALRRARALGGVLLFGMVAALAAGAWWLLSARF